MLVATTKQDCRDPSSPERPLIAVGKLLLDGWSGHALVVTGFG
jgi:hypothetical protein